MSEQNTRIEKLAEMQREIDDIRKELSVLLQRVVKQEPALVRAVLELWYRVDLSEKQVKKFQHGQT